MSKSDINFDDFDWLSEDDSATKTEPESIIGNEEPTPYSQSENEEETLFLEDDPEDEEAELARQEQEEYEEELSSKYAADAPQRLFKHDFMRANFLNCITMKGKSRKVSEKEFDQKVLDDCYSENNRGNLVLDQIAFCELWHESYGYEYLQAGVILTPEGAISQEQFRSHIMQVFMRIKTETKNVDLLVDRLMRTYMSCYPVKEEKGQPVRIPFANGDLYINKDKKGFTFKEGEKAPVAYRFPCRFKNISNRLEPPFPMFKKWITDLFEEDDIYTIKQLLGYLMIPSNEAQEAFFIIGKAGTGKSILTDCIIKEMLGEGCFPISLGQFFNDKFQLATSVGKLCMVDDDIGGTILSKDDSGRFKNFVTSDTIKVEAKYCAPAEVRNFARIVCSGNHMIESADKTDGFTRRLHPIYVKPVNIEHPDPKLKRKIAAEIDMIVLWALEGLLEMLNNDGIPYHSSRTDSKFEDYAESQKWEEQFVRDCYQYQENSVTYSQDISETLAEWLKENSDLSNDMTLTGKMRCVVSWLKNEGKDKYGFIYKRGIKRGDSYGARGFINMSIKQQSDAPILFTDTNGKLKLRVGKKKKE